MKVENNFKEKLKNYCSNLGFDLVSVVSPGVLKDRLSILQERRNKGYYTTFENPDLYLRVSPEKIMPEVKSILILGLGYYTQDKKIDAKPLKGTLARYARGADYHKIMKEKMNLVIEFLYKHFSHFQYKVFVDSSPLVERGLAEKTGLGFTGKNSCFYTQNTGSYIFLGEILLSIDMESDEKLAKAKGCNECDICVNKCPTGALLGDYTLNPTKCLAYISQKKGIVPKEYRKKMGSNLIGCDICQDICPTNQNIKKNSMDFKAITHLQEIDLCRILTLSNSQFKSEYGDTAFGWCGKKTIQRNALIALGNQKAEEATSLIIGFLEHPDYVLRVHAAWALGEIGTDKAITAIKERLIIEKHPQVIEELKDAINKFA